MNVVIQRTCHFRSKTLTPSLLSLISLKRLLVNHYFLRIFIPHSLSTCHLMRRRLNKNWFYQISDDCSMSKRVTLFSANHIWCHWNRSPWKNWRECKSKRLHNWKKHELLQRPHQKNKIKFSTKQKVQLIHANTLSFQLDIKWHPTHHHHGIFTGGECNWYFENCDFFTHFSRKFNFNGTIINQGSILRIGWLNLRLKWYTLGDDVFWRIIFTVCSIYCTDIGIRFTVPLREHSAPTPIGYPIRANRLELFIFNRFYHTIRCNVGRW